ncbi:BACON domain-containing protein, partial [Bacteroides heparinolyticus]
MFNKKMAMIGMIMSILCGIISCDDDEFATRLEIGEDVLAEGIEAEIDGKIATLNISSNDNWTIDVPKDASHWVYLPVNSGQGDQNVLVNIDANFGSSAGRSTTLTITAGDIVKKVTVTQVPTFNGQTVSNDDETADYIKIAATKGVGMGLNLGRLTTKNSVINLKALDKLQQLN